MTFKYIHMNFLGIDGLVGFGRLFLFVRSFLLLFLILQGTFSFSQVDLDRDTVSGLIEKAPAFSIYKDNYFIVGLPLSEKSNTYNSDAKFQFSFKQRLRNKPIALGAYLYFTYTQKSFWDIFRKSSPFAETNYNPGFLLIRPMFHDNKLLGALSMTLEHESNGRDSIFSRSWNFLSVEYIHIFSHRLNAALKIRLPFMLSDNPNITDYVGYADGHLSWMAIDKKLYVDVGGRLGKDFNKGSLMTGLSWKPFTRGNQYITFQWWHGYSESLIDYQKSISMVRVGLTFKPTFMRFY